MPNNLNNSKLPRVERGVAGVFATMNRPELAKECIRRLSEATCVPELLVIADNSAGKDGLVSGDYGKMKVEVLCMPENLGNAGGIEQAIACVLERKMEWIWILDDDSLPNETSLEALRDIANNNQKVYSSLVVSNNRENEVAWPVHILDEEKKWKTVSRMEDLPKEKSFPTRGSWLGAFVPVKLVFKYGNVCGDLFIRGEDEEFPRRLAEKGVEFEIARDSLLEHPSPPELVCYRAFGKELWLEPKISSDRAYYKVRNMIWMARRQQGFLFSVMASLVYPFAYSLRCGLHFFPGQIKAVWHAWTNRLGKR